LQEVKVKQSRYRPGVAQRVPEIKVKQSRYRTGVAQRVPEVKVLIFLDNGTGRW
jgi:hypothetical protein